MIKDFINGIWLKGGNTFETLNPANCETLVQVAQAVQAATDAFPAWAVMPVLERPIIINELNKPININVEERAVIEDKHTGLPV